MAQAELHHGNFADLQRRSPALLIDRIPIPADPDARDQSPAFDQAEAVLTALEGGRASLLFSSGMAAATAVFQALAPGDHVLAPRVMYWSLRNWLTGFAAHWGLEVELLDMSAPSARDHPAVSKRPPIPWWTITDIALVSEIAHAAGAAVVVDSTVATPVLTQPLALGADIVMHAATKYLNGHSDVVAGTLTTRDESPLWLRIRAIRAQLGGIPGPFEAWLLTRGSTDRAIAGHFAQHPQVAEVLYPGLPSFHGHAIAARECAAVSAGCCRFSCAGRVALPVRTPPLRRRPTLRFGSARPRWAAWRA